MKKGLTLLLSLVLVLAMSVTAFAAEDWVTPVQNIEKWDEEVDFLVVGYGLAGAAAAVEAYDIDPTAKILVLEKMPETLAGGNSIASGQTFLVPAESAVETVKTYLYNCNKPNPIPDEYLTWLCEGFATQLPWIEYVADGVDYEAGYVGGGELKWGSMVVEFSNFEGSTFDGCSAHLRAKGSTFENGGVWRCFAKAVEKRGIDVRFENPAVSLVQDPFTKEVSGVIARRADGTEYSIKSAKGVLLACGGYENNLTMQRDFHGMETVYTAGTPGNTGDGIKMLMEAGAQIWHMKNQTQSGGFWLGIKVPEYDSTFMRNFTMAGNSWIEIDSESKRFYDEAGSYHRQHMKYMEYGRYVDLPHERALPVSLIFDEKTREAGSIGSQWLSWPTTTEGYTWSNDNLAEIEKGTRYDILFLDVIMPAENGITAAKEIRQYDNVVKIIFLTSSAEFAVESYVVGAYFYQLKPIWEDSFFRLTDSVIAECRRADQRSLILRCKTGISRIDLDQLLYCEVLGRTAGHCAVPDRRHRAAGCH